MLLTLSIPATTEGVLLSVIPTTPSWPEELRPQQYKLPSPSTAQVCDPPNEMFLTLSIPATTEGVLLTVVPPIPSWPYKFQPQQYKLTSSSTAQEWY
mmetsp:Transcript_24060/g.30278  ORF Transcript_24060/g.30278 Transcript_24060/m.30278 type:complete len:97 (+) Transcript_24060:104-394(+)